MAKRIRKYTEENLPFIGAIGSICSIAAFVFGIFTKNNWVLAPGYVVFAISLSTIAFWEMHYRKRSELQRDKQKSELEKIESQLTVYKEKANSFHLAFHTLREASTLLMVSNTLHEDRNARFINCLEESLSNLADFFSSLTKHKCSLCIKSLIEPDSEPIADYNSIQFATLVRDKENQWRSPEDEIFYTLGKNTAFRSIWAEERRWFYSPDLLKETYYENENVLWHKKHHYLTTAVVPIQAPRISMDGQDFHRIQGYLAIDSPDKYAFKEQPTVYLLACFADMLYVTLKQYRAFGKDLSNVKAE